MQHAQHHWTPYCGPAPDPANWFSSWNLDFILLVATAAALCWSWRRFPDRRRCNVEAFLVVLILYVSPLCALGSALFSVRALHHAALALLLAPLLAQSLSLERFAGRLSLSAMTFVQAIIFWFWHAPGAYAAALSSDLVFWAMQISMTGSAALWWASLRGARAPAAVAAILATMVQMGALGALLTFAGRAFYAPHFETTQAWGWTPLEDQQIGGLIMWAPVSGAYLLLALFVLFRALAGEPRVRAAT